MHAAGISRFGPLGILKASSLRAPIAISTRSYYKKKWSYDDHYTGKFDYHDHNKYPKTMGNYKEEELLDEIHAIRRVQIEHPSPFHVITRVRGPKNYRIPWHQNVILRRLNIHSSFNGDVVVVPNTPQYNEMINKVKHLITLKPVKFANGKLPTEDDIGALKVCPSTGEVKVDEKLRLRANRLNLEKPLMFQGNFLRNKLNLMYGSRTNHYLA